MPGTVRVISGKWRGRKIKLVAQQSLRPSLDRVRETLFNWLRPHISGATCLDCFAGSGILGVEALSQGAQHVTFIEQDPITMSQLKRNLSMLQAQAFKLISKDFFIWIDTQVFVRPVDIIFIDPPFEKEWFKPVFDKLRSVGAIGMKTRIYLEASQPLVEPPDGFKVINSAKAGNVHFHLIQGV